MNAWQLLAVVAGATVLYIALRSWYNVRCWRRAFGQMPFDELAECAGRAADLAKATGREPGDPTVVAEVSAGRQLRLAIQSGNLAGIREALAMFEAVTGRPPVTEVELSKEEADLVLDQITQSIRP